MPTCLYANISVSTSRAYMLPASKVRFLCLMGSLVILKSSHSSVTVPSVPPICLTTSVRNNVIKKPITCCNSVIKRPRKWLRKRTIAKNRNAVNYVSKPVNNVVNFSRSISKSSSGFVCQTV